MPIFTASSNKSGYGGKRIKGCRTRACFAAKKFCMEDKPLFSLVKSSLNVKYDVPSLKFQFKMGLSCLSKIQKNKCYI